MKQFSEAVRLHQQGMQTEARLLCEAILQRDPGNAQVLALHGTVNAMLGLHDAAIVSFERAAARQPRHAQSHYMLGNLYRAVGKLDKAAGSYRKAISCQPAFAEALNNLGLTLGELGKYDEELQCYEKSIALNAANPLAWFNLGNALQRLYRFDDAAVSYTQALQLDPNNVDAWFNLGNAQLAAGKLPAAIATYERIIARHHNHVGALGNLGVALRRIGDLPAAELTLRQLLTLQADNVPAMLSLGNIHADRGDATSAITTFKQAIALAPDYPDAHFNLGNLLHRAKRYEEAAEALEAACNLQPEYVQYLGSLTGCYMALWNMRAADEAWQRLINSFHDDQRIPMDVVLERSDDLQFIHQCAVQHARQVLLEFAPSTAQALVIPSHASAPPRLRIGYLSPDFGEHPVGTSLVEVLERHDRSQFEISAIALREHPDGTTRNRIVAACDRYLSVEGLSLPDALELIRQLDLDLLIDLAGYTADSRPQLLSARPARVQAAYLGYAATTAAPWLDYLIADPYVVPSEVAGYYSERIAWLDTCFFPSDTTQAITAETPTRAQEGLPEDAMVLCCFNNPRRISLQMMQTWLQVLATVDRTVLWLGHTSTTVINNLREFAAEQGVDPQRLVFSGFAGTRTQHLARHRLADLYVDTFPYNSHSTARDALYMGVPLVTLSGKAFASRVAGSLLTSLGMPELITSNLDEYICKIIELATHAERLQAIRNQLAKAVDTSTSFKTASLTSALERGYAAMIARHHDGLMPTHFKLEAGLVNWM